jgi:hypothetical protein
MDARFRGHDELGVATPLDFSCASPPQPVGPASCLASIAASSTGTWVEATKRTSMLN